MFCCFGQAALGVLTVQSTHREGQVRILEIVKDVLPSPDPLELKEDGVKVTLSLGKRSTTVFKAHDAKSQVLFQ